MEGGFLPNAEETLGFCWKGGFWLELSISEDMCSVTTACSVSFILLGMASGDVHSTATECSSVTAGSIS